MQVKTTATDLADTVFTFSNVSVSGSPKGFGLMLTAVGYAYDRYGFMVAYVDDTVLVYRSGSASGSHASTGTGSFAVSHFIGAVALAKGATGFTLRIAEETDALAFYVNDTLAGKQALTDGKCMIGDTEFNYHASLIGLVPCYKTPTASGDAYSLTLGTSALKDGDAIAFDLTIQKK